MIAILASAVGYGTLIPSLLVSRRLRALNVPNRVYIVEGLFSDQYRSQFLLTRKAFSQDERLAQIAARLPIRYERAIDRKRETELISRWKTRGIKELLCFSASWLPVLSRYIVENNDAYVCFCQMDESTSVVWDQMPTSLARNPVYKIMENGQVNLRIAIDDLPTKPFHDRNKSVVLHGGGWCLGDFRLKTIEIPATFTKNTIVNHTEMISERSNCNYFIDTFQPNLSKVDITGIAMPTIKTTDVSQLNTEKQYHNILDVIADGVAIVAKPGGMTVMDAIITTTPLVYLNPVGKHEVGNSEAIEKNKIGISYSLWKQRRFSMDLLFDLHHNLQKIRSNTPDLTMTYLFDRKIKP